MGIAFSACICRVTVGTGHTKLRNWGRFNHDLAIDKVVRVLKMDKGETPQKHKKPNRQYKVRFQHRGAIDAIMNSTAVYSENDRERGRGQHPG